MKQSFIVSSDVQENELQVGLMDFANLYSQEKFAEQIELFRKKGELEYLIFFNNEPDFERFAYAVNYIRFLETKNGQLPLVTGYFNNGQKDSQNPFLDGNFVKVYVSRNDKEYDNVNIVDSENDTYRFDFGGAYTKLATIEESFELPHVDLENYNHLITIIPAPAESKPWWKFW